MEQALNIFLSILEIIVILGVLISVHEAGHLGMAKAFNVYCFEYSIGFGPALLHKKRKKGETYFSIRAIPLGGYCSMYGEPGVVPEGFEIPPENRSLEKVAKWKKALVLVAGVTLNFILGLVLIFVSDIAFPHYYFAYGGELSSNSNTTALFAPTSFSSEVSSYIDNNKKEEYQASDYYLYFPASLNSNQIVIVSTNAKIDNVSDNYVVTYYPSTLLEDHDLSSSLKFYSASKEEPSPELKNLGINYLPDLSIEAFDFSNSVDGTKVSLSLCFAPVSKIDDKSVLNDDACLEYNLNLEVKNKALSPSGNSIRKIENWLGWNKAWSKWASDVPTACGAVVQGFASLFTKEGLKNVSGIVGMTAALPSLQASGGAANIFFFAGLISINLAFFNLLPFPALDGWALLVTAIEGISKKKVPAKVQSIMSILGMVLLFGLMIAVTIKDIVSLVI
ncbi:MAG TPA: hypothetical protein DCR94_01530 [Firmicutes bacterium]|nr:hypothetical protein [Bacillota bacterium]